MGALIGMLILASTFASSEPIEPKLTRQWTDEVSKLIESTYWNDKESVYVETVDAKGVQGKEPSFMWGMGVLLSGYAAAITVDTTKYTPLFDKAFQAIEPYWSDARGLKGYAVWPRQGDPDRYYDDNAWVALALVEAYEATENPKYLKRSIETHAFVTSCEDDKLGGGLYWHEKKRNGKNTCTNGPAIVTGLRLYEQTHDKKFFDQALRLYNWAKRLQDEDGLWMDNQNLSGRIERTKWTYNTALMLRATCLLYDITKEQRYLDEAVRVAEASWKHWYRPEQVTLACEAMFAHHLFEAYFEVSRITNDPKWKKQALPILAFVHGKTRNEKGLYTNRWDRSPEPDRKEYKLLHQASALRAYAYATAF